MDIKSKYMTSLLQVDPKNAKDATSRVYTSKIRLRSHVRIFKAVCDKLIKKAKEYITGSKEEINLTLGKCSAPLKKLKKKFRIICYSMATSFLVLILSHSTVLK